MSLCAHVLFDRCELHLSITTVGPVRPAALIATVPPKHPYLTLVFCSKLAIRIPYQPANSSVLTHSTDYLPDQLLIVIL
jgi:hypothetical protein